MHLVIDGYEGEREKMQDAELVYQFLDSYPAAIGMTKISRPHVLTYNGVKREDWGVSGFVLIAESHISIHTFPSKDYVNIDVFSCKSFDAEKALEQIKAFFSLGRVQSWLLERGVEYIGPRQALVAVQQERAALAGFTLHPHSAFASGTQPPEP